MANRKDIISGAVMEVPLDKGLGYGYVKLIFAGDLLAGKTEFIAKIYNLYRKESYTKVEFKSSEFETDDLLLYPLLMRGYPRLRGDMKWRYLGQASLTKEDQVVPDYRAGRSFQGRTLEELEDDCKSSQFGCPIVRRLMKDPGLKFTRDFESIKHIWEWSHYTSSAIRIIASLLWMREFEIDPMTKFSKHELENDHWIEIFMRQIDKYGIDFRRIQQPNRLHAIIQM